MRLQLSIAAAILLVALATEANADQLRFSRCSGSSPAFDRGQWTPGRITKLRTCGLAMDGVKQRFPHALPGCAVTNTVPNVEWRGYFTAPVALQQVRLLSRSQMPYTVTQSSNVAVDVYDGVKWHRCGSVTGRYGSRTVSCRVRRAKIVRIWRRSKSTLVLCEVEAFGIMEAKVVAHAKFVDCSESSPYYDCGQHTPGRHAKNRTCELAMDGRKQRFPHALPGCAVTNKVPKAEWRGYFLLPVHLKKVALWGRSPMRYAHQSTNIDVDVHDGGRWRRCAIITWKYRHTIVACDVKDAMMLRVRRRSRDHLTLCEVKAFALESSIWPGLKNLL